MKKQFLKLMIMIVSVTFVISCGSDDDNNPIITCGDGVQNGDETGIDCGGSTCEPCAANTALEGDVTGDVVLDASLEYQLVSAYVVQDGGSLTIPAGTVIKATGGTAAYIAVAQGGKIYVQGTADKPVVMTSGASSPAPANWGGLVLCGKAPTNENFYDWLSRQDEDTQNEAIGAGKAELLRSGKITTDDLVNDATSQEYSLAELKAIHGV